MEYKVVVTAEAQEDINQYIRYLIMVKKSDQAAKNVLDDFEAAIQNLKSVAGSLINGLSGEISELLQYKKG